MIREAPLLFEGDFYKSCDANVLVIAPPELRIARAMARSGLSRAEVERRIAAQIAPERARELADYTLENDGSLEELRAKATELFHKLKDV